MTGSAFRIIVLLTLISSLKAQYIAPVLKQGSRRIGTMIVLPARVEVNLFGLTGSKGIWEGSDVFEDALMDTVARGLSDNGVSVLTAQVSRTRDAAENDDNHALSRIQQAYDTLYSQMHKSMNGVAKGKYSLGDAIMGFAPVAHADTVVFIRGKGTVLAHDKLPLDLTPFSKKSRFDGWLAFVDARSGSVLALLEFTCDGHPWYKDPALLIPHIQEALHGGYLPVSKFIGSRQ